MVDLLLEANASTKLVTNDTQSSCLHIAAKSNAVRENKDARLGTEYLGTRDVLDSRSSCALLLETA